MSATAEYSTALAAVLVEGNACAALFTGLLDEVSPAAIVVAPALRARAIVLAASRTLTVGASDRRRTPSTLTAYVARITAWSTSPCARPRT